VTPAVLKRKKPVIGLAGGIGAGKSTVARLLNSLGAGVIDSDTLGHEVLQEPDVVDELRSWWGENVVTPAGNIDRQEVGRVVFADPAELERLEDFLYPRIGRRRDQLIAEYELQPAVRAVVIDAPKLFEAGVDRECDVVWFIEAGLPRRIERVTTTRNWTPEELTRRENLQNPLDDKKNNADLVIENNFDLDRLASRVEAAFESFLASFSPSCSESLPETSE
jgi:dephospho-CoA kinase